MAQSIVTSVSMSTSGKPPSSREVAHQCSPESFPIVTGRQEAGVEQDATFDVSAQAPRTEFTPFVQAMRDNGSTYAIQGGAANTMIALMKEARLQGVSTVKVWDCSLQCSDRAILANPETEGLCGWTQFLPFDERKQNLALRNFIKNVGRDKADGFGGQAWASGLLLRDAVNSVVADGGENAVTRASVLAALPRITAFDADGMLGTMNPGDREPSACFALSQVKGAKFVRVYPKKAGTFDCDEKNLYRTRLELS